jgi:hypothetical protein
MGGHFVERHGIRVPHIAGSESLTAVAEQHIVVTEECCVIRGQHYRADSDSNFPNTMAFKSWTWR